MKVFLDENGDKRLIGRAEVTEDCGPVYEAALFGAASTIVEAFAVGTVTHLPEGGDAPVVERAVLAAPGQFVELLPGWEPVASLRARRRTPAPPRGPAPPRSDGDAGSRTRSSARRARPPAPRPSR